MTNKTTHQRVFNIVLFLRSKNWDYNRIDAFFEKCIEAVKKDK